MVLDVNVPSVGSHRVAEDSALIGGRLGGIDIPDGTFTVAMVAGVFNLKVGGRVITDPPQIDPRCVNVFQTVGPRHIFGLTQGFKGSKNAFRSTNSAGCVATHNSVVFSFL